MQPESRARPLNSPMSLSYHTDEKKFGKEKTLDKKKSSKFAFGERKTSVPLKK